MPTRKNSTPDEPDILRSPEELRQQVRLALARIIEGIIGKAKAGSYPHAKFLCEFAGIAAGDADNTAAGMEDFARRHSVASLLRERLVEPPPGLPKNQGPQT